MDITLYTLTSAIHDPEIIERNSRSFLEDISAQSGCRFIPAGQDFSRWDAGQLNMIFVRTGGTEGLFKAVEASLPGRIILLTSGKSNSLAASMEILSYLRRKGRSGEIIHGSTGYIAERVRILAEVHQARQKLRGTTVGVIGRPSDWLISSSYDPVAVEERLGIRIVDIPISELVGDFQRQSLKDVPAALAEHFDRNAPERLRRYREGSFKLYLALDGIVRKYHLDGLTVRCFDLLTAVENTGCLALAVLNARGIPACCEGDVPALLTMMVGHALTGVSGFQANPSRIDPEEGKVTFAHCTVPLDMVREFSYDTHFESGIGVAIKGELPQGPVTLAKISGEMDRSWFMDAELLSNLSERDLCRTQVVLRAEGADRYFLHEPIGNHHLIFPGHCAAKFKAFWEEV